MYRYIVETHNELEIGILATSKKKADQILKRNLVEGKIFDAFPREYTILSFTEAQTKYGRAQSARALTTWLT